MNARFAFWPFPRRRQRSAGTRRVASVPRARIPVSVLDALPVEDKDARLGRLLGVPPVDPEAVRLGINARPTYRAPGEGGRAQ